MQDGKIRSLIARVNFLPNKTEMPLHHSKPSPSLDALVSEITHLRSRLLPAAGFEQCTLYRGTLGVHKVLTSATDGVLVFWNILSAALWRGTRFTQQHSRGRCFR